LRDENLKKDEDTSELLKEATELTAIFIASRITAAKNLK